METSYGANLKKIRNSLCVVTKLKNYLNHDALLILYHSLVLSHIMYCNTIWCHANKTIVDKLQRTANRFLRMVFNTNYRDSVGNIMKDNNLLTINQLAHKELAILMFKYNTNRLPSAFKALFQTKDENNDNVIKTRSNSKLIPSFCRLSTTQQSLKYKGPVIWNKLPHVLRTDCKTLHAFSKKIHAHILSLS